MSDHKYEFKQVSVGFTVTGKLKPGSALYLMAEPLYEPVKRNHDGMRHHRHRFPIKGGISHIEVMQRQMAEPNPLYAHFFGKAE